MCARICAYLCDLVCVYVCVYVCVCARICTCQHDNCVNGNPYIAHTHTQLAGWLAGYSQCSAAYLHFKRGNFGTSQARPRPLYNLHRVPTKHDRAFCWQWYESAFCPLNLDLTAASSTPTWWASRSRISLSTLTGRYTLAP